jgi:hypothetical protein
VAEWLGRGLQASYAGYLEDSGGGCVLARKTCLPVLNLYD